MPTLGELQKYPGDLDMTEKPSRLDGPWAARCRSPEMEKERRGAVSLWKEEAGPGEAGDA